MVIRVVKFSSGGTKLERFLPNNQHTQRKLLNFENWCNNTEIDRRSMGLTRFQQIEELLPPSLDKVKVRYLESDILTVFFQQNDAQFLTARHCTNS
jgi:hypothetical protein